MFKMKDPLQYTKDEIIKNLILTETHLKQATTGLDEQFCIECLDKHFYNLEGLGDEGISFTKDQNEIDLFSEVATTAKKFRGQDYKEKGVEYAQKVREIRKKLYEECPNCKTLSSEEIENLTKDLNTSNSFNILAEETHTHNSKAKLNEKSYEKMKYAELGYMNAGQFAAEGVRYLAETQASIAPYEKYVTIGGGIALQALGLFMKKLPPVIKTISIVAGSNLLAGGVVKLITEAAAPAVSPVAARVNVARAGNTVGKFTGQPNGRVFGGKVTASNIPSQYARAGILAGAQAFEAPEHADLIRVD